MKWRKYFNFLMNSLALCEPTPSIKNCAHRLRCSFEFPIIIRYVSRKILQILFFPDIFFLFLMVCKMIWVKQQKHLERDMNGLTAGRRCCYVSRNTKQQFYTWLCMTMNRERTHTNLVWLGFRRSMKSSSSCNLSRFFLLSHSHQGWLIDSKWDEN